MTVKTKWELWIFRIEGNQRIDYLHKWNITSKTAEKRKDLIERDKKTN